MVRHAEERYFLRNFAEDVWGKAFGELESIRFARLRALIHNGLLESLCLFEASFPGRIR